MIKKSYDVVCLVSNDLSYDRRMIRVCDTLYKSGKSVLLIGRQLNDSPKLAGHSFDQYRIQCNFNSGMLFYAELVLRFNGLLKNIKFKSLLLTDLDTILTTRLIRKFRTNFILDLHEYFEEVPELQNKKIKKYIWRWIERICVPKCEIVYTVNGSLASIFSKRYNRQVGVIRNVPAAKNKEFNKSTTILNTVYLGVLNPGRGLTELILQIRKRSEIRLTVIGNGPLLSQLKSLSKGYDNIMYTGALQANEISSVLCDMHFGWNLLDGSSQSYFYSLANKLFDYLHHRIPVITMKFPEYEKIVNQYQCGFLIEDLEEETLESVLTKIQDIFIKQNVLIKLQDNCDKAAQENNWNRESQKLLEYFQFD